MHQIAGGQPAHRTDQEGGVCRTAEDRDTGQDRIEEAEHGRPGAERVQDQHNQDDHGGPYFAILQQAAPDADRKHEQDWQRADVDLAHVLRQAHEVGIPVVAVRTPERHLRIERTVEIADDGCQQRGRVQRATHGLGEFDRGAIGGRSVERRHQQGQACEYDHGDGREDERRQGAQEGVEAPVLLPPMSDDDAREHVAAEQGDLIRFDDHGADRETGKHAVNERRAVECAHHQPEGYREEGVALHLADVLDAPSGRSAESEDDGGNQSAGGMPATVTTQREDCQSAAAEQQQDVDVEIAETRDRLEPGQDIGG